MELQNTLSDYESAKADIEALKQKNITLKSEHDILLKRIDFIQKEMQKRLDRSKAIELNMKEKIKSLESEIARLKS